MKSQDFERLTRRMATPKTRRGLLAAFAGGLAAAALGSALRPSRSEAVPYCTADSQCPQYERCTAGFCVGGLTPYGVGYCTEDSQCPQYERCAAGVCVGGLTAYATSTAVPDAESTSQVCLDGCHASAIACHDGCGSVAYFIRGRCWQQCISTRVYCEAGCPTPPPAQD